MKRQGREQGSRSPLSGRRIALITAGILVLGILAAGGLSLAFSRTGAASPLERLGGVFSFYLLGQPPRVYGLEGEKNGSFFTIRPGDALEVTYRDEFILRGVASDSLAGSGIDVRIEGFEEKTALGVLFKGLSFVDRRTGERAEPGKAGSGEPARVSVLYNGREAAVFYIRASLTAQDFLRYARAAEDRKEKIHFLQQALALTPSDTEVRHELASEQEKAGRVDEAAAAYEEILKAKPADEAALTALVKIYLSRSAYDRVVSLCTRAVATNPKSAPAHAALALALQMQEKFDEAAKHYESALQLDPNNTSVRFRLGEVYDRMKKSGKAGEQYRRVLTGAPADRDAILALALTKLKAGDHDEAIYWYKAYLKQNPKSAAAWANLGLAYGGKGRGKEEIESYRKALALDPKNAVVLSNMALAYEKANQVREATDTWKKVLKVRPGDSGAASRLGELALREKRYREAASYFETALKESTRKGPLHTSAATAYAEMKQYGKAVEHYEKAIRNGVKDPEMHLAMATAYQQLGKNKEAEAAYGKAAASGASRDVLARVAAVHLREKRYDQAAKIYREMIRRFPGKGRSHAGLGDALYLKGDMDGAADAYRKAVRQDPREIGAWMGLGAVHERKGNLEEALKAYQRAWELNPDLSQAARKAREIRIRLLEKKQG
ncbi:MAG TPA: tetratricopeptide repeat protein [Syntrophales bacterium]|nr:tetratricopeptide repeat protein [Syntrophales bacterium]